MPLINHQGERISYECEDLIKELEDDIAEFGGDMIVDVVTMRAKGEPFTLITILLKRGNHHLN